MLVGGRGGDTTALGGWVRERLGSVRRIVQPVVSRAELPSAVNPSALNPSAVDPSAADPSAAPGDPDQGVVPYPGPGEGPTVVVELEPVLYEEPVRFYWRIRVEDEGAAHGGEPFEAEETGRGAAPEELVQRLRRPLAEAFQGVDTPDRPAPLEVALPVDHFDTAVHRWQLSEMARLWDTAHLPLGARRPVVLRDIARRGDPAMWWERWDLATQAKEFTAHRTPPRAGVPRQRQFTELPATAVPVLCRPAARGLGRKALDMALEAGHGIVLWHTEGHTGGCQDTCETFHQGAAELLRRLGAADELPDRMRRIREQIYEGRDAGHWAEAVAVLYDDPRRPIPTAAAGTVDSP
ncbi:hypothetical protein AB0C51_19705 [Streptomyces pathocidini]|uniref:VMAP-C domain-containing protein n=1 Tax=Streptomyces pathocidini TaxID=1650571 RepID=UPI0033FFF1E7